jgi:hypothetical protein
MSQGKSRARSNSSTFDITRKRRWASGGSKGLTVFAAGCGSRGFPPLPVPAKPPMPLPADGRQELEDYAPH